MRPSSRSAEPPAHLPGGGELPPSALLPEEDEPMQPPSPSAQIEGDEVMRDLSANPVANGTEAELQHGQGSSSSTQGAGAFIFGPSNHPASTSMIGNKRKAASDLYPTKRLRVRSTDDVYEALREHVTAQNSSHNLLVKLVALLEANQSLPSEYRTIFVRLIISHSR